MADIRIRLTILVVIFAATILAGRAEVQRRTGQKRLPDWSIVPYDFNGWAGIDASFDPVYGIDPADTSLLRTFRYREQTLPVIAYVGFYANLSQIMDVHTPELCYPAQGWEIISSRKPSAGLYRGLTIPAREILVEKNGERRLVMWWYSAGSQPFEDRIRYIYSMLFLSSFTGRTDGSMVRLEAPVAASSEAETRRRIEDFRKDFLPVLERALPR